MMNVAILSNSYGEGRSGALIAKELKVLDKSININAFPLISFGEEYRKIINIEARDHVYKDMGQVYFADDYKEPGFWKRKRGF